MGEVPAGGLVVIVGPNSSGKTQFLRDIYARVTGQTRELVVCEAISLRKPTTFDAFLQCLVEQGAVHKIGTGGAARLNPRVSHFGIGGGPSDLDFHNAQLFYQTFPGGSTGRAGAPGDQRFLQHFGPMLSTALFLENRLATTNQTNNFEYLNVGPTNDVQSLYLNSAALDRLKVEVRSTFGKAIGIDPSRPNSLIIRVSDLPPPPDQDWISPDKVSKLRAIESEGDGLRSYCAVCIALLLGTRPICLIDEPEMCLHPPQAHALGRFIGEYGTPATTATFVATHSSHVLRGILETAGELRIVRLVRVGGRFIGRLVNNERIRSSLKRPAARSEVVLDGIFADAVTIVEADTDRVAYQAALDLAPPATRRDTYFATVGELGGIAETARFYRELHIPVAAIADLDLILDPPLLGRIVEALGGETRAEELARTCEGLTKEIRLIPPDLGEEEIARQLAELAAKPFKWEQNDDESLVRNLRHMANAIDRVRKLKSGGVAAIVGRAELKSRIENAIEECKRVGLFLVSVGDLEYWSSELMGNGPSREKKAEWANEFVKRIRDHPAAAKDIIEFVTAIDAFHGRDAERLA